MNIFYVDTDPRKAAISLVDSHVVKMILESAQMLSTAHRLIDGKEVVNYRPSKRNPSKMRKTTHWALDSLSMENNLYKATHVNHPSSVWVRQSISHYYWLYNHFDELLKEYTFRFDDKHNTGKLADYLQIAPNYIPVRTFRAPPEAMDPTYIFSLSTMENYRHYYRVGKAHLHKYTKRQPPDWLIGF